MKGRWKSNGFKILIIIIVSIFYALPYIFQAELLLNSYRIKYWLGMDLQRADLNLPYVLISVILAILFLFLFLYFDVQYFYKTRVRHFALILWIPFSILVILLIAKRFPIQDPAFIPGAGTGFILIGFYFAHEIYLLILSLVSYLYRLWKGI